MIRRGTTWLTLGRRYKLLPRLRKKIELLLTWVNKSFGFAGWLR
jgi:hypothetical protein